MMIGDFSVIAIALKVGLLMMNLGLFLVIRLGDERYLLRVDGLGVSVCFASREAAEAQLERGEPDEADLMGRLDAGTEQIEEMLDELRRSGAQVTPILGRSASGSQQGHQEQQDQENEDVVAVTPPGVGGRRGVIRCRQDLMAAGQSPAQKRMRLVL